MMVVRSFLLSLLIIIVSTTNLFADGRWIFRGVGNCLDRNWQLYDYVEYTGLSHEVCASMCERPEVRGLETDHYDGEHYCKCLFDNDFTAETVQHGMLEAASKAVFDLDGNGTVTYTNGLGGSPNAECHFWLVDT